MLKCIAIDDEPLALRQLQGYIAKINFLKLEKAFTNAIEAQQYLAGNPIDLIFVDINMPDLSGVEFVRSLVSRPMIIFTTAYSEYAVEGFKLDAIDYLLKPFSFADFSRSAAKAQSLYELLAYRKETPLPRKPLHATGSTSRSKPTTKRHWYASATSFIWKAKANTYGSIWTTDRPSRLFSGSRTWKRPCRRKCSCGSIAPTSSIYNVSGAT